MTMPSNFITTSLYRVVIAFSLLQSYHVYLSFRIINLQSCDQKKFQMCYYFIRATAMSCYVGRMPIDNKRNFQLK